MVTDGCGAQVVTYCLLGADCPHSGTQDDQHHSPHSSFPLCETLGSKTQIPSTTLAPLSTCPNWVLTNRVFDPQDYRQHLPESASPLWETLDSKIRTHQLHSCMLATLWKTNRKYFARWPVSGEQDTFNCSFREPQEKSLDTWSPCPRTRTRRGAKALTRKRNTWWFNDFSKGIDSKTPP